MVLSLRFLHLPHEHHLRNQPLQPELLLPRDSRAPTQPKHSPSALIETFQRKKNTGAPWHGARPHSSRCNKSKSFSRSSSSHQPSPQMQSLNQTTVLMPIPRIWSRDLFSLKIPDIDSDAPQRSGTLNNHQHHTLLALEISAWASEPPEITTFPPHDPSKSPSDNVWIEYIAPNNGLYPLDISRAPDTHFWKLRWLPPSRRACLSVQRYLYGLGDEFRDNYLDRGQIPDSLIWRCLDGGKYINCSVNSQLRYIYRYEQQPSFSKPTKRALPRQWLQWTRWAETPSAQILPNSKRFSTCST